MELRSSIVEVFVGMGKTLPDNPATSLLDAGTLDSISILELVNALEDRFDIEFEEDDLTLENFATLETIERIVATRSTPSP